MRGSVIGFDPDNNIGAIDGDDGRRYDFVPLDWHGPGSPTRGVIVEFVPDGQRALQIAAIRNNGAEGSTAQVIYILYLVSMVIGLTGIVALIMAYVNQSNAPAWVATHYRFQIRTFWIGLLYALISVVTMFILIGFLFALFTCVWWIVRCAKGLKLLSDGAPHEHPSTWLW